MKEDASHLASSDRSSYRGFITLGTGGTSTPKFKGEPKQPLLQLTQSAVESSVVWRGDRVAEGARLESVCTGNRTEGSNPSLSVVGLFQLGRGGWKLGSKL